MEKMLKKIRVGDVEIEVNQKFEGKLKKKEVQKMVEGLIDKVSEKRDSVWLFVWGTLMRGQGNHHLMKEGKQSWFLGKGKTIQKFLRTGFITTFEIPKEKEDSFRDLLKEVEGEVYLIKKELLETNIDALEGYPKWYTRELKDVVVKTRVYITINENGKEDIIVWDMKFKVKAWMYFFKFEREEVMLRC